MAKQLTCSKLESLFSKERFDKYSNHYNPINDNKAIALYKANICISESLYPLLSVLEITLRNAIDKQLSFLYKRTDWYNDWAVSSDKDLNLLYNRHIKTAVSKINSRKEKVTHGKIIAELTFGFWVQLFNIQYQFTLWSNLRLAFPNLTKKDRQRHKVSPPLNRIRNLRNRIYHYEPIVWNLTELKNQHKEMLDVLLWLDKNLASWVKSVDRFKRTINREEKKLNAIP